MPEALIANVPCDCADACCCSRSVARAAAWRRSQHQGADSALERRRVSPAVRRDLDRERGSEHREAARRLVSDRSEERRRHAVAEGSAPMVASWRARADMPIDGVTGATRPVGEHTLQFKSGSKQLAGAQAPASTTWSSKPCAKSAGASCCAFRSNGPASRPAARDRAGQDRTRRRHAGCHP